MANLSMISVTKTYLPPIQEYIGYLKKIWKGGGQLANHGPLVGELESKLKKYLGVKHLFFVTNGTTGLQIAIRALDLKGEIITTPFSYVASTSSIVWENCKPVFVDVDPETLCIDPKKIEAAITKRTEAILPVHIYGNVCDVEDIEKIAKKHKLKVIYDSAHAFGIRYKKSSVLEHGDINILSFHATKIFQTAEGGAVIAKNSNLAHRVSYLRNFGHRGQEAFWGLGINGKNSELHAAMGLCLLPRMEMLIKKRKKLVEEYDRLLKNMSLQKPLYNPKASRNYSYYPVLFESEEKLLKVRRHLNKNEVFPRRYFYPSLNTLGYIKKRRVPIAESASKRVLCLPLYHALTLKDVRKVSELIGEKLR